MPRYVVEVVVEERKNYVVTLDAPDRDSAEELALEVDTDDLATLPEGVSAAYERTGRRDGSQYVEAIREEDEGDAGDA